MKKAIFIIAIMLSAFAGFNQSILTYKKDWQGNIIAVDNRGSTIFTEKSDLKGNTIWVDNSGHTFRTFKEGERKNSGHDNEYRTQNPDINWRSSKLRNTKDAQGNTIVEDENGHLIGTFYKDELGNVIFIRNPY